MSSVESLLQPNNFSIYARAVNAVSSAGPVQLTIATGATGIGYQLDLSQSQFLNSSVALSAKINSSNAALTAAGNFLINGSYINNAGTVSQSGTTNDIGDSGSFTPVPVWTISGNLATLVV